MRLRWQEKKETPQLSVPRISLVEQAGDELCSHVKLRSIWPIRETVAFGSVNQLYGEIGRDECGWQGSRVHS
jgi:hypothetical protein